MFSVGKIGVSVVNITHRNGTSCTAVIKRFKKKKVHWAEVDRKNFPTDKALAHFDDFYKTIFRLKWPSVRLGILSTHKYIALLNNFGDVEETQEMLENLGALDIRVLFANQQKHFIEKLKMEEEKKEAESVLGLDEVIKNKVRTEEINKLNLLYPDGSGEKLKGLLFGQEDEKSEKDREYHSESDSDEDGEVSKIDTDRLVSPEHGIDSSSLQEFVPATKLKGLEDYVGEADYYNYYKTNVDIPIEVEREYKLDYPEHLKVYSFARGDMSTYPSPTRGKLGLYNYYLMDGSSILPVLALGLKPGDTVLDMCAAPGGKSLAALQTLYPKLLVANDVTGRRKDKVHRVFEQYLYGFDETSFRWKDMLLVTQNDGGSIEDKDLYDKILVDVPCTNDRLSLIEDENNIFKPSRLKERLQLPVIQCGLLANALRLVRPGGTVVYSTCTLSPIQNDGVVHMALRQLWEETKLNFKVIDMTPALQPTSSLFKYGKDVGLKFGHLVLPFLPSNFGPLYFCKIVKCPDKTAIMEK